MSTPDNALIDAARGRDQETVQDKPIEWKFIEFNDRRWLRGAPAARVEADGDWLWMTPRDIRANIKDHGDHPELQKALAAYKGKA